MMYLPENVDSRELLNTIRELSWEIAKIFKSYNQRVKNPKSSKKRLNIRNFKTGPVTEADIEISELK